MIDFDWAANARTRPGYVTYRDTRPGDPTSPYRPVRSEDAATIATDCSSPATCTACRHQWFHPAPLREQIAAAGDPLPPLPDSAYPPDAVPLDDSNCPAPDRRPANVAGPDGLADDERDLLLALARERTRTSARSWLLRMTRRKP